MAHILVCHGVSWCFGTSLAPKTEEDQLNPSRTQPRVYEFLIACDLPPNEKYTIGQ